MKPQEELLLVQEELSKLWKKRDRLSDSLARLDGEIRKLRKRRMILLRTKVELE